MPDSLSRTFSRYVSYLTYESLPSEVIDKMKACLLHGLVISVIGAETEQGKAAIGLAKVEESRPDGATILVDGGRATRYGSAFANSALMHVTNQDDSYKMLTHPGVCIIPAGLATAQLAKSSGRELITALAAGYEVACRVASDFIPSTQARGFRSSPIYGTLGTAVATAKLLNLGEDQLVTTLALACTFASGTNEGPRTGGREMLFHEPNATRNGIMAALIARRDIKGAETALEGDAGFYNAFVGNNRGELSYAFEGPDKVDLESVIAGLGESWELMHVVQKVYPTEGYNCPVIELMTEIRAAHQLNIDDIEAIDISMNWLETSYPSPAFPNATRSVPGVGSTHYFAAYTCVNSSYPALRDRIDAGAPVPNNEQIVMDLLKKVEVTGHKDRPAFAPKITIRMRGGTIYEGEYKGNELEWDLAMETRRISELFNDLRFDSQKLNALVETITGLETEENIESVIDLCIR